MSAQPIRRWDREIALLAWLTACVSILSFLFYLRRGEILLYGDAVAHINIARRVFDSRTPGLLQLGTVWLPLPHLLMIPFLLSNWMWKTGVGGSIPSMVAYVFGTVGIFRLVRGGLGPRFAAQPDGQICGLAGCDHLCRQSESDLSASDGDDRAAVPGTVHLGGGVLQRIRAGSAASPARHSQPPSSSLIKCGICLAAACLTRYDGWFLAVAMCVAALARGAAGEISRDAASEAQLVKISFCWLQPRRCCGWLITRLSIAIRWNSPMAPTRRRPSNRGRRARSHPGSHDLRTAFSYFLKSAELNLAAEGWQKLWILLALAGVIASLGRRRFRGRTVAAASALGPGAVLRALRRLQRRAHLHARMVAVLLLQRALRIGTASGIRRVCSAGGLLRRGTDAHAAPSGL